MSGYGNFYIWMLRLSKPPLLNELCLKCQRSAGLALNRVELRYLDGISATFRQIKNGSLAMFACPHCQFENPVQNRFCQRCGHPLKGLRVIVTPTFQPPEEGINPVREPSSEGTTRMLSRLETAPSRPPLPLSELLIDNLYLPPGRRYQLRYSADTMQILTKDEIELDILDCQPADESPVKSLLEPNAASLAHGSPADVLPSQAFPYWQLQEQFFPVIPELQAAWRHQGFTFLVIEDRAAWRQLVQVCSTNTTEPLEFLHWFYEMIELWESLAEFGAEPSLLSEQNLVLDEDQILCLRRLRYHFDDRIYTLKDLGVFWQFLLDQVPENGLTSLRVLATKLAAGHISEIALIRKALVALSDELQEAVVSTDFAVESSSMDDFTAEDSTAPLVASDRLAEDNPALISSDLPEFSAPGRGGEAPNILETIQATASALKATSGQVPDASDESINDLPTMALPMKLYRLDEAGQTHVGRQRTHNEDYFSAETDLCRIDSPSSTTVTARGLYILCDGMGGHAGGEIASALAVETLQDYFAAHWQAALPDEDIIKAGILRANDVIYERNEQEARTGSARMGTTLVMVLMTNDQAIVAHVGDSRLYCYTRSGFRQITVDHEVGQREIALGVDPAVAYARPDAYQLTQALGPRNGEDVLPSIATLPIGQDTLFLLCSDGLSDNELLEKHIETHVKPLLRSRTDLDEGVANLIDLANEFNGHDNITAIAVRAKMRPNLDAAKEELAS